MTRGSGNSFIVTPPISVMTPAHLSATIPRAVMNAARSDPGNTTIELTNREIDAQTYHGVRLVNEKGRAVVFAAKVAWRTNTLLERFDTALTEEKHPGAAARQTDEAGEENVLVQLACVSEETWERLDDEILASSSFYALIPTVVQDMVGLKESFPPLHKQMLGDPRVLDLLGIKAGEGQLSSGIRQFMKDPSIDTFSRSVRKALQKGAALFMTGQRALPELPRKMVDAASELFRKRRREDILKVSATDLDEPQPLREMVIRIDENEEYSIPLESLRDAAVLFQDEDYSGNSYDQMYVVRSEDFMRRLVNWKRAFMILSIDDKKAHQSDRIVLMSNWEEARRHRSPHITIRRGLRLLLGRYLSENALMMHEGKRGYIRPGDNGSFEVFSLSGERIFDSAGKLSSGAEHVREAFQSVLGVDVDFVEDDDIHSAGRLG